ncbi:MAG: hypothetical protein AAGA28_01555 [Pseudomonadota bacterium]
MNSKTTTPPTSTDLEEQLVALDEQIGRLKVERRDAIIEGTDFDQSLLRDAEDRRDALQAALDELYRREQEAARIAALEAAQRSAAEAWALDVERITTLRNVRRDAINQMERGCRRMMAEYLKAERARAELSNVIREATGKVVLNIHDTKSMQSILVQKIDRVIKDCIDDNHFGHHELKVPMFGKSNLPWFNAKSEAEREIDRILAEHAATIPDAA